MLRNGSLAVIAAFAGALVLSGAASAQEDCPRGTLDKTYCDRNGDLTADLPTDPKKIINPSELVLNVSSFPQGIYFVELQSGEKVLRGKFLKE
jgi:hypothetical protein